MSSSLFLSSLSSPCFHHRHPIFCYLPTAPNIIPSSSSCGANSPTKLQCGRRRKRRKKLLAPEDQF
ncbi:hypothetical protein COLO4_37885 [Corchorus olitorius]|uniref:Uncharacterized protein n=1 Tax=Corchorus olitorius TaxID=93759 RepID=A0A1R3FYC3_9ROSI|nr:hypothetical protein COLO4_37885 [Corchorus olitorius]